MSDLTSLRDEIHKRRQSCGKKLQQTYGKLLDMFDCVLANELKRQHPYQLNEVQLCSFGEKTKLFSLGGVGDQATLSGERYIYRIINKGHLPNYVKFKWPVFNYKPDLLWNFLRTKSNKGEAWLDLQEYAENSYPQGAVRCWFSCTWWTSFPLDKDVVLGAYTIGMFSEWVTDEVFIMRALIQQIDSLEVARVPTVIDAFMQPVFQPVKEPPPPNCGITIDLSNYNNPAIGVDEFFVHPIEVKFIEIKPIELNFETRQHQPKISQDDPQVLRSLLTYYDAL